MKKVGKRLRRTADEAQKQILDAAEELLSKAGPAGIRLEARGRAVVDTDGTFIDEGVALVDRGHDDVRVAVPVHVERAHDGRHPVVAEELPEAEGHASEQSAREGVDGAHAVDAEPAQSDAQADQRSGEHPGDDAGQDGGGFAERVGDGNLDAAGDGNVEIYNTAGSVKVEGWSRNEIEVTGTARVTSRRLRWTG